MLGAAVATLPGMAVVPPLAAAAGVAIAVTRRFKPFNLIAWIILPIGLGLFSTLDHDSSHAAQAGYQSFTAIGGGIVFSGRLLAVQAPQKRPEDTPMVTTLISLFTSLGQAFGLAVGGTVFENCWTSEVERHVALGNLQKADVILARNAESAALQVRLLSIDAQIVYADVVSQSLRVLWITLAALATSAFLATLFQRNLTTVSPAHQIDYGEDDSAQIAQLDISLLESARCAVAIEAK